MEAQVQLLQAEICLCLAVAPDIAKGLLYLELLKHTHTHTYSPLKLELTCAGLWTTEALPSPAVLNYT